MGHSYMLNRFGACCVNDRSVAAAVTDDCVWHGAVCRSFCQLPTDQRCQSPSTPCIRSLPAHLRPSPLHFGWLLSASQLNSVSTHRSETVSLQPGHLSLFCCADVTGDINSSVYICMCLSLCCSFIAKPGTIFLGIIFWRTEHKVIHRRCHDVNANLPSITKYGLYSNTSESIACSFWRAYL